MTASVTAAVGIALRAVREAHGLTVQQAADLACVSADYLADVESGTATASPAWIHHVNSAFAACKKNAPEAGQGFEGRNPTPNKEHENMDIVADTTDIRQTIPALPSWATGYFGPNELEDGSESRLIVNKVSDSVEVIGLMRTDGSVVEVSLDVADQSLETLAEAHSHARDLALGTAVLSLAAAQPDELADTEVRTRPVDIDGEGFVCVETDEPLTPEDARSLAASLILSAARAEAITAATA